VQNAVLPAFASAAEILWQWQWNAINNFNV
jgi:hypothetical protein